MTGCRAVLQTCVCLWLLWAAGYVLPIQADPLPDDMVLIPAGEFTMGTAAGSGGLPDEQPLRRVYLGAFWIDRYEATNTDYQRFVEATGYQAPAHATAAATLWEQNKPIAGIERHPVVNVNWLDAVQFCRWAGKRLPTEAEWEKAARGTDGRTYPWGNEWDLTKSNSASYWAGETVHIADSREWEAFWLKGVGAAVSKAKGIKGEVLTMPVGSFPEGASPYGVLDMAGNAAEWVQDWYNPNFYRIAPLTNPQGPDRGAIKAMRGGSWLKPAVSLRTTDRDWGTMDSRPSGTGFRCARDAY
ncbi:MAG: Serine/threonine-protein kinase pkn1 [Nitrospirae bacterium]|nr:Serine/threonine-protein kinase pkn1 [Nitrospirota bacterium]MCE7965844.1 formylglycine-generating enzyme family protein [Nitrospira sp. NTP2]MCK6493311.1 formylglycine-generating enzyme family protein [Nitrospira sp.]MEB2338491.1 formylglycine-generating enzyme family protein [Nitrospirales bacterium]QOJ33942.1 MAG: formylglycine-generating enzyme family protein [Nitrospira sp.]